MTQMSDGPRQSKEKKRRDRTTDRHSTRIKSDRKKWSSTETQQRGQYDADADGWEGNPKRQGPRPGICA
jgi:hypothetical protein